MPKEHFIILDSSKSADFKAWMNIWNLSPEKEVFAHPSYLKLYSNEDNKGCCAIFESDEGYVLYPFIVRNLKNEKFFDLELPICADIISPYGYGGPYAWDYKDLDSLSQKFWGYFNEWATDNNIVSEVIKFNLFTDDFLRYPGSKEEKLKNIVVDLNHDSDSLWMSFKQKVRKNVKKARQNNVVITRDETGVRLKEFLSLYYQTMQRRSAAQNYYFPVSFFEQLNCDLKGMYTYFHASHDGRLISSELALFSRNRVYSFLGGTSNDDFNLRSNDLLKYEIINWAKDRGKSKFILGGGCQPNDGIYNYKLSFAPKGIVPFSIGWRIFHDDIYRLLIERKGALFKGLGLQWEPKHGFIPEYRT